MFVEITVEAPYYKTYFENIDFVRRIEMFSIIILHIICNLILKVLNTFSV